MRKERGIAVVVAGGSGTRMKAPEKKQYLDLCGKTLMTYAIAAMEQSAYIDDMVVVVSPGDEDYVRDAIVMPYGFTKVRAVVPGGRERYHSVFAGLRAAEELLAEEAGACISKTSGEEKDGEPVVYIQDAARPFLTEDILKRVRDGVLKTGACVAAMPVKDTIKQADAGGFVTGTPDRATLWAMQTPQAFSFSLVFDAYRKLMEEEQRGGNLAGVTDDARVVERAFPEQRIFLAEGSYRNIKVTTPEDLIYARDLLAGKPVT